MEDFYEEKYHQVEKKQWWFVSRRDIILGQALSILKDKPDSQILEIGCSSGLLTISLEEKGLNVTAIDISPKAVSRAQALGCKNVQVLNGGELLFPDNSFDLIIASDVLEHIEDDANAVRNWKKLLKPGGYAIVYVPAFSFLWSKFDEINCHFKRYRLVELENLFKTNGLSIKRASYWNFSLFLPVYFIRKLSKLLGETEQSASSQINLPSKPINSLLLFLLKLEKFWLLKLKFPFGISCFVISQK